MQREECFLDLLPEEFLNRMKDLLGEEYAAFAESYTKQRVQGLRFNELKGSFEMMYTQCRQQFGLTFVPWCREGFYYRQEARPGRHPFHEAGVYYIQEPSAMAVVSLLDPQPGEKVLDLCAAPGGKATHAAGRMKGEGLLVANEIHPARAEILSRNIERMGIKNAVVTNEEPERLRKVFKEFFDKIIVDAPCSGEGMFRKEEQALKEWSRENVSLCAKRQQEILDNAAAMLKPGGQIVYSTCTFSPEENERGIVRFLHRHPDFIVAEKPGWPCIGVSEGRMEWCGEKDFSITHTFRIWPHLAQGEGHFLALMEKKAIERAEQEEREKEKSPGKGRRKKDAGENQKATMDKEKRRLLDEFLAGIFKPGQEDGCAGNLQDGQLVLFGQQLYRMPAGMVALDGLSVLRPGLHLGTFKKNRFEPSHALALSLRPEQVKKSLRLKAGSQEIKAFLSGSTLPADKELKGWVLVCVEDYSVGWAKASGGVLKNHYPKGLRIYG